MTVPSVCERATAAEISAVNASMKAFKGKATETNENSSKPNYLAMVIAESCAMAARGTTSARAMRKVPA